MPAKGSLAAFFWVAGAVGAEAFPDGEFAAEASAVGCADGEADSAVGEAAPAGAAADWPAADEALAAGVCPGDGTASG
ncbi:MAG: hypothetical protein LBR32_11360, partial [Propionibacteriaceae bacterium]|nr:hypothetical protein [Propionibacteriaceae bacterium]